MCCEMRSNGLRCAVDAIHCCLGFALEGPCFCRENQQKNTAPLPGFRTRTRSFSAALGPDHRMLTWDGGGRCCSGMHRAQCPRPRTLPAWSASWQPRTAARCTWQTSSRPSPAPLSSRPCLVGLLALRGSCCAWSGGLHALAGFLCAGQPASQQQPSQHGAPGVTGHSMHSGMHLADQQQAARTTIFQALSGGPLGLMQHPRP